MDAGQINKTATPVIKTLSDEDIHLPYPCRDWYELWLLDREQQLPFVLLNSAISAEHIRPSQKVEWLAVNADMPTFTVQKTVIDSVQDVYADIQLNPAAVLVELMRKATGRPPMAQWFLRDEDGNATGMHGAYISNSLEGRTLSQENLPKLLLKTKSPEKHTKQLISAYLYWQAPYLLTLQNLEDDTRAEYEHHLSNNAIVVSDLYKLYPKIINQDLINRALVEAELRITAKGSAGD